MLACTTPLLMVQSFVTVSTVQLLGQRAYAARANPGPKWLTDTERRFRARCGPGGAATRGVIMRGCVLGGRRRAGGHEALQAVEAAPAAFDPAGAV